MTAAPSPLGGSGLTGWRTPTIIVLFGCIIAVIAFGPRSTLGLFLMPISSMNGWGRDVMAFALAIQNLLWGPASPSRAPSPTVSAS